MSANRHVGGERTAVVGGGIVGLAVAREVLARRPGAGVTVFEKEDAVGLHQTGHNSGVVHAGLYYKPGSLKATLCTRGRSMLREFCAEHGIAYRALGKVVVATSDEETGRLHDIHRRARANGVPGLALLDRPGLAEVEPWTRGVAAVHSPETAVVDFGAVARALADELPRRGGTVLLGQTVRGVTRTAGGWMVTATGAAAGDEPFGTEFDTVVVCAGLGTDALARNLPAGSAVRTVPFRGEYYRLAPRVRDQVNGLVYPVPDPRYPFLGVHLTRRWDDEVLVGPNAVLALAAEGYRRGDIDPRHLLDVLRWPGFRRLAGRHWRTGVREVVTTVSRRAFTSAARRYLPGLTPRDLVRHPAGVRAQALDTAGGLVDDFVLDAVDGLVVVRNAPSPAATSSLAIAEHVVGALTGADR